MDVPVRGSLLVWIDNMFGNPQSEDRRMFGIFQTAMVSAHTIPDKVRSQIVFKCFPRGVPAEGTRAAKQRNSSDIWYPQRHGDFSQSPFWDSTFWSPRGKVQ